MPGELMIVSTKDTGQRGRSAYLDVGHSAGA